MISWTRGKWEVFGDVTVDTSDYKTLCVEVFEQELVAIPEAVTFYDATFICDFMSGKIYSADDEKYDPGLLYNTLKTQLDIQVRKIKSSAYITSYRLGVSQSFTYYDREGLEF